ncbi:MAG: alpha/beta hydrolase [Candidatus Magnetomorum sp.]|nr:alpha/beta hydrolase [Candidatus Magnetomorum sp.]
MSQPVLKTVDLKDTHIQYLHYSGQGPVIIMLHATGFLPWLWHPIAEFLNQNHSFEIIAPYFCDHRDIDPEKGGVHWALLAEDLKRMCQQLNIQEPHLIGHSMGAVVATLSHTACNLPAQSMILIEPIFLGDVVYEQTMTVDQHPLAGKAIRRRNFWQDLKEVKTYLRSKALFKHWDEGMLSLYIEHGMSPKPDGGFALTCSPRKEAALFMGGMHRNPWPLLKKIQCPTLVIEGGQSENQPFIDLKKATEMIPKGEYQLVENAGHLIPMEFPHICLELIDRFLQRVHSL